MAADILYSKIYGSVAHIKNQAERMDALKEDARKLHRYLKRVEAVVSDLQPYYIQQQTLQSWNSTAAENDTPDVSTAAQVLAGLHGVQAVLSEVQDMLEQACSRGKLSTYLQADRLLQQFQSAVSDLESSVANLPCSPTLLGSAYDETTEQIDSLRSALRKVKFELSREHAQQLEVYRDACDSLQGPLQQLQGSCRDILQQACGHTSLTRDEFAAAVADLQQEVRQLQQHHQQQQANGIATCGSLRSYSSTGSQQQQQQPSTPTAGSAVDAPQQQQQHEKVETPSPQQQQQQQNDEFYLRMMCDLLRVNHQHEGVPLEFTCPLTTAIMQDPVILHETGHSYERQAIEDWFASGHRLCPKSGTTLGKKLNISPNHALKAAIRTWCEQNDLQLKFRPLLRGAVAESKNLFTPAFGAPLDSNGRPLPASSTSGQLSTILAAGSGGISPSSSTSTDLDAIEGIISSSSKQPGGISLVGTGNATAVVGGGIGSAYVEAVPVSTAANISALKSNLSVSDGQSVELIGEQNRSLEADKQLSHTKVDQGQAGGLPEAMEPGLPVSKQLLEVGEAAADAPAGVE